MADASTKEAPTNTTPRSCVDVNCDCHTMWSLAQQFSSTRLCMQTGEHKGRLVRDYAVRARRIAATYARFYLETEEGGDLKKRGRYYWMALGAFASKTVACTFEAWQVKGLSIVTETVWQGLGKGNFWLFCDISGWHWYHNVHYASFQRCLHQRDAKKYVKDVRVQITKLPWNESALPIINYFSPSSSIKNGFANIRKFENSADDKTRRKAQFDHLIDIANHEQGVILQPLIYNDPAFASWVKTQRARYAAWASPALELVFTHQCSNRHLEVKSVAPTTTELENLLSRMEWITDAAKKFHNLMQVKSDFMHSALTIMASWVDLPDSSEASHGDRRSMHDF